MASRRHSLEVDAPPSFEVDSTGSRPSLTAQGRQLGAGSRPSAVARSVTCQLNLDQDPLVGSMHGPREQITQVGAMLTLIAAIIGAGIMALPQLPVQSGLLPSSALCVATALYTLETGLVFTDAMVRHNELAEGDSSRAKILTFEDFGREGAGEAGAQLVRASVVARVAGLCSGYAILLGQQLKGMSDLILLPDASYRTCVLMVGPILWLLSMMRDTVAIAKLMPLATAAGVASCVLIVVKGIVDAQVWKGWDEPVHIIGPPPHMSFMAPFSALATLNGAFGFIPNVPTITADMADVREFNGSLYGTMAIITVLYWGVVVAGHYGYGDFVEESIVDSMMYHPGNYEESRLPLEAWTGGKTVMVPRIMCIAVAVNILLSYPLNMMCVFVSVESTSCGQSYCRAGTAGNYIMRSVLVGVTVSVALMTEKFGELYAVIMAVLGPLQGVFFVFFFAYRIRRKCGAPDYSSCRKTAHCVFTLLGIGITVFGLYDSLNALLS